MNGELQARTKDIEEKDAKILKLQEEISKKDFAMSSYDQTMNTYRLKINALEASVKGLEAEKAHLEMSLAENRELKDNYYEKSEIAARKYQETFEQLNEIQKEVVAVDELKRDRDERIDALR